MAEERQRIRGLRFAKDVSISHLLFADDSLIFMQASVIECKHLKEIFYCYTQASGQLFNLEKSCMFFSGKISEAQIIAIKGIFNLKVVSKYEKYLGLPPMIGINKTSFLTMLNSRCSIKSQIGSIRCFPVVVEKFLLKL